jgi:alkylhydroperoxidase family enzyme
MGRITPLELSHLPHETQDILAEETRRYGAPLNTTLVWARHPALLGAYKAWGTAFRAAASLIPEALTYLVYVRVASLNGCPF